MGLKLPKDQDISIEVAFIFEHLSKYKIVICYIILYVSISLSCFTVAIIFIIN